MDEKQLLLKAQEGDIESFENVISNYQNYIYNVIYRLVDVKEDALDLTQETLIKAYINLKKFKGNSEFKTWLYRIAVNVSHDFIRKKKGVEEHLEEISDFRTPENIFDDKVTRKIIIDELNKLKREYKTVLILRDIEGLTYNEIAEITNTNIGTVKSRISRARNILKENLKKIPGFINVVGERGQI
ncbi:RNA polymerase sigma factor [Thermoanaerobacterium butyriciformans]|uniref:RNA polymerase sigma factor n=1 Tax=Thermoanaerobacterium butyriciformans TaxID=1702242 RepID=A0ABS4NHT2_9THEO|nr:sigma-70 family RNA polymerase sigma factor [Thermoanaerobacterium butyriciformans]MBP2073230.1 RNA polymerase sigma-70 factor (ECF subfamily) [Thermoanaerobacterium butyriciformans]